MNTACNCTNKRKRLQNVNVYEEKSYLKLHRASQNIAPVAFCEDKASLYIVLQNCLQVGPLPLSVLNKRNTFHWLDVRYPSEFKNDV